MDIHIFSGHPKKFLDVQKVLEKVPMLDKAST